MKRRAALAVTGCLLGIAGPARADQTISSPLLPWSGQLACYVRNVGKTPVTVNVQLFGSDAIWVAAADYPHAKEVLDREAAGYASAAREKWRAEWRDEHGSSYARWLWSRARNASMEDLVKAILLIVLVSVMLLYPLALVLSAS